MPIKKQFLKSLRESWADFHITVPLRSSHNNIDRPIFTTSNDAFEFLKTVWDKDLQNLQEQFVVLFLNRANKLIGWRLLNSGSSQATITDVRLLVCLTLQSMAHAVIIAHNHPSNRLKPSVSDGTLTKQIKSALELINSKLIDHIILGTDSGQYLSFADEGLL